MPYSDADLEALSSNPVAMRAYFWRVAMGARRRSLMGQKEITQRGRGSPVTRFKTVFSADRRARDWAETEAKFADVVLGNLDAIVRGTLERPKVCPVCRGR